MLCHAASAALFFVQFELITVAVLWCAVGWEAVLPSLLCHVTAATQASKVHNMGHTMLESNLNITFYIWMYTPPPCYKNIPNSNNNLLALLCVHVHMHAHGARLSVWAVQCVSKQWNLSLTPHSPLMSSVDQSAHTLMHACSHAHRLICIWCQILIVSTLQSNDYYQDVFI